MQSENVQSTHKLVGSTLATFQKITNLIELKLGQHSSSTVQFSECLSLLLLGPLGSGKSYVLTAICDFMKERGIKLIHLMADGSLCDLDSTVLNDLRKQLVFQRSNQGSDDVEKDCVDLLSQVQKASRSGATVLVSIEHIDMFCHSARRQTLLYTLLDMMHDASVSMILIGLSRRCDTEFLLEKRIRSRFQLRRFYINPPVTVEELADVLDVACGHGAPKGDGASRVSGRASAIGGKTESCIQDAQSARVLEECLRAGYSLRDFVGCGGTSEAFSQYEKCISMTDASIERQVVDNFALKHFIVTLAAYLLHVRRTGIKTFEKIYRAIEVFERRSSVTQVYRHTRKEYVLAFMDLLRMGVIRFKSQRSAIPQVVFPTGLKACGSSDWGHFPIILTNLQFWGSMVSNSSDSGIARSLPVDLIDWASSPEISAA